MFLVHSLDSLVSLLWLRPEDSQINKRNRYNGALFMMLSSVSSFQSCVFKCYILSNRYYVRNSLSAWENDKIRQL